MQGSWQPVSGAGPPATADTPEPVNATVSGELVASEVTVIAPVLTPVAAGLNVAAITQVALAAKVLPQVPLESSAKPVPEIAMLEMLSVPLPVLLRVVVNTELVSPTVIAPKSIDAGLKLTTLVALTPTPVKEIVSGELGAFVVTVIVPVFVPVLAGVSVAPMRQVAPAARLPPQVPPLKA